MRLNGTVRDGCRRLVCLLAALLTVAAAGAAEPAVTMRRHRDVELAVESAGGMAGRWEQHAAYPRSPGRAGLIAGANAGALLVAGGANFPGRMPWEGGVKAYYNDIFVQPAGATSLRPAGELPEPRAYAATASLPDGVLALGGENAGGVFADSLRLTWEKGTVRCAVGPKLPAPRTNAVAAVLDGKVYLAGGYAPGAVRVSCHDFWRLDLARPEARWEELPTWPGPPRAQAVLAAFEGAVYLFSGLQIVVGKEGTAESTYLHDAYRFRNGIWERLPDLPWSVIAAPSPAPTSASRRQIFVLGGVDGRQAGRVPRETRVPGDILCFDVASSTWRLWSEPWPDPVVTTPAVRLGDRWWFVSGEISAGVRTTSVWSWQLPL